MTFKKQRLVLCGLAGVLLLTGCAMMEKQKRKEDEEFGINGESGRESTYNDFKKDTNDNPNNDTRYLLTDDAPSRSER